MIRRVVAAAPPATACCSSHLVTPCARMTCNDIVEDAAAVHVSGDWALELGGMCADWAAAPRHNSPQGPAAVEAEPVVESGREAQ